MILALRFLATFLLEGQSTYSIVEPEVTNVHDSKLKLWGEKNKNYSNYLEKMVQIIRVPHNKGEKWMFEKGSIQINDLLIIKEGNVAICNRLLDRIVELFPSNNGRTKVEI